MLNQEIVTKNVTDAIKEDLNSFNSCDDITAQLIDENEFAKAQIITREDGVFCGRYFADEVFKQLDNNVSINWFVDDGDKIVANQTLCEVVGNARILLTGERIALNFIQTLSAIATTTNTYVNEIEDTNCKLLDTRKTIPCLRDASKYAVTCGKGHNHRMGLYDAFLIKENHIMACGGIYKAIKKAKEIAPNKKVEVEVENLNEFEQALNANADIIMLDNFTIPMMQEAVAKNQSRVKLEVSGNVNLQTIKSFAKTGVDFISVGAITKNVQALDLSMRFE